MKTEKIIKQQAREALQGNVSALIAMMGVVAAAYLLLNYVQYVLLFLLDPSGAQTGTFSSKNLTVHLIQSFNNVILLLLSPLFNGALRGAAQTAQYRDCSAGDVFYYFRSPRRWGKTVLINLLVFSLFSAACFAFDIGGFTRALLPQLYEEELSLSLNGFLAVFIDVVTVILRVVFYMLFIHFPLTAYALHEHLKVEKCVFIMIGFSVLHFGKLFRLMLSFIGWLALCFFVVPALYVIPYYATASMLSSKWLFELDEGWSIA